MQLAFRGGRVDILVLEETDAGARPPASAAAGPAELLDQRELAQRVARAVDGLSPARTGGALSGPVLPRRAIVITREIMEATLAKLATYNPGSAAPGVFAIYGANPVVLPSPPPV